MMGMKPAELASSDLRNVCRVEQFHFMDTSEIEPLDEVIGQKRAVQSIDFGLNMKSPGYNIFVTGVTGTGKSSIVKDIVSRYAAALPAPDDWCMVNNFKDEYCPRALRVPSGKASSLSKSISRLIEYLKTELPKAFETKTARDRISELQALYNEQQKTLLFPIEKNAEQKNIRIIKEETSFQPVFFHQGKPVTSEDIESFSSEKKAEIEENLKMIQAELEVAFREINRFSQIVNESVEKFMDDVAHEVLQESLQPLLDSYRDYPDIIAFLKSVEDDVVENIDRFVTISDNGEQKPDDPETGAKAESFFLRYNINVLVEQKSEKGAPVIFETNPTYQNLIGRIEKRSYLGALTTDFSLVQAGSILKAGGGYIIMEIEPLLINPFVWEALKRALQNKFLAIEDIPSDAGYQYASIRPESIPLEVKVILLGSYELFEMLQNYDSKFNKIFRVRADFDYEAPRDAETVQQYARFIASVCREQCLLPFNRDAVAAVVEFGGQSVEDKTKLSLSFGPIIGLLKEADYWARKNNSALVTASFVNQALREYRFRYNLYEEKIHESYMDGSVLLDLESSVVGQVNALSVYNIGDISFGRPSRITAETFMGKPGIINIERETNLSGNTHDKGVLILSGYLGKTFAQLYPLSLTISIAFEQNYGVIDGDSASSSELYAVISSLSEFPVSQGIAVTGSVNQKGEIQAIGGVNEKIEGFFEVCREKGLTGRQGVIIPSSNVKNLMLKEDVIEAVGKGMFHVYPVNLVTEGIEILTGISAGTPDENGLYPDETVYGKVQKKLRTFLQRSLDTGCRLGIYHAPFLHR